MKCFCGTEVTELCKLFKEVHFNSKGDITFLMCMHRQVLINEEYDINELNKDQKRDVIEYINKRNLK